MRQAVTLFLLSAVAIVSVWAWLGAGIAMPPSPLSAGEKLYCVSYAPFRDSQDPWGPAIPQWQMEEDLARLKTLTDCVRTYSVDRGLDKIASVAKRHGMSVIQGLWLSSRRELNREQIDTTVALARAFPDTIRAIVVGNEALLRGEMAAPELAAIIREVKSKVGAIPVTYADVWEFWLRNRDLASAVDFVTIHILPYWEDDPIPVLGSAAHVDAIRKRVADAFPGKEVLIGETGWPSAGRMREGALPSPSNQARFLTEVLAATRQAGARVNVIEAFDQPWKRRLEGTVGGYWGLFDGRTREAKFAWGEPVSDHPHWRWQATGGVALALAVILAAWTFGRSREQSLGRWIGAGLIAAVPGVLLGWTVENAVRESLFAGDWLRSLGWVVVAIACPPLAAAALMAHQRVPAFACLVARTPGAPLATALGLVGLLAAVLAIQAALGLVFDPRYRDFPFAPLTAVAFPLAVLALRRQSEGGRAAAETVAAILLGLCAGYIALNESFSNWQSLWLCGALLMFTFALWRVRDVPG